MGIFHHCRRDYLLASKVSHWDVVSARIQISLVPGSRHRHLVIFDVRISFQYYMVEK